MGLCLTKNGDDRKCPKFCSSPVQDYYEYQDLPEDLNNLDLLDICSSDDEMFDLYFNDDTDTPNNKYTTFGSNCINRV
jgi:hypothetical protein